MSVNDAKIKNSNNILKLRKEMETLNKPRTRSLNSKGMGCYGEHAWNKIYDGK
jgi:hypothetical protein